ncbi:MAG: nuclear transport factor 2 family protein [Sphingomicrobium sp.]
MATDLKAQAQALEATWRAALIAKDEPAIRALIHPDFKLVGVRPGGEPISVDLDSWMTALQGMDIAALEIDVIEAVGTPATLVATLDACWKVRFMHQCIDERVLLTDVWVREDERWRVIRRHTSFIPAHPPHC